MSPLIEKIAFLALSATILVPAAVVVTARNIPRAGFALLPVFLGVAGMFLVLGSEFLAAVQVLLYAGAILVLLLFALMLTRSAGHPDQPQTNRLAPWAVIASGALAGILAWVVSSPPAWQAKLPPAPAGVTAALGQALLKDYVLSFEVASVVLLAAMIGALVLARREV